MRLRILGVVLCLIGAVWFLQGVDVLGGSGMSGHSEWAWIGGALIAVGVFLLGRPATTRRE